MPYTSEQVRAIAARYSRTHSPQETERYMSRLKKEAIAKHGYFIKGKAVPKKRKARPKR